MTTKPVPSLGSRGWVDDPDTLIDQLFANMLTTDFSQSQLYSGNLTSLQYLVKTSGHDPQVFCTDLQETLERYLGRYFDLVQAKVTSYYLDKDINDGPYGVRIEVTAVINERRVNLLENIQIKDSRFIRLSKGNP